MAARPSQGSVQCGDFRFLLLVSLLSTVCVVATASPDQDNAAVVVGTPSVYEMLKRYGLPQGLLPMNVMSYTLSPNGHFSVNLGHECEIEIQNSIKVHYEQTISGFVRHRHLYRLKGIKAKLRSWIHITGIQMSSGSSGKIIFRVGLLAKMLEATEFTSPRPCIQTTMKDNYEDAKEGNDDNEDDKTIYEAADMKTMSDLGEFEEGSEEYEDDHAEYGVANPNTFIS